MTETQVVTDDHGARLATAPRNRGLIDLVRYPTTRKLLKIWLPFWLIVGALVGVVAVAFLPSFRAALGLP